MPKSVEVVLNYHQRTKHGLQGYAKGPETIDWEDQPDPFRRFSGCRQLQLPKPGAHLPLLFADLDQPDNIKSSPLDISHLGLLLELAFGLSAWKEFGPSCWSLRCNPSSGNLHPTEAYLISTGVDGIDPGVYHYVSHDHGLEQRCVFSESTTDSAVWIGLSSIHWREAWKYGERAYRYCQHDIGHALAALGYAAATLGWTIEIQANWADEELSQLLGLNRTDDFKALERESPDVLCRIQPGVQQSEMAIDTLLALVQAGAWQGSADSLKAYHFYQWSIIDEVSQAASKPRTIEPTLHLARQTLPKTVCRLKATELIRQRRSGQQFDGKMPPLAFQDFKRMLAAVLPTSNIWQSWRWPPAIHLFLFVHRVDGLAPGIYALPRSQTGKDSLQAATLPTFIWQEITEELPLFQLSVGDCKQLAKTLSCHQPIASDSAFSLAMVGEFSEQITEQPWHYRRLFWECGIIGQILYLEAEAAGVRGTGIGCYFDDQVHDVLGLKGSQFQSLYHFSVGKALEDKRLQTLPAYGHLA